MKYRLIFVLLAVCSGITQGGESIEYSIDTALYEGYYADAAPEVKKPGVVIVHQWRGITDHEKAVADSLAGIGYAVFALDMYGKGIRPENNDQAKKESAKFYKNPALMRQNALAGIEEFKKMDGVDNTAIVAIGYCFGGTAVLHLARSGVELAGVVSFHGGLKPLDSQEPQFVSPVAVHHGAADPFVEQQDVDLLIEQLKQSSVDWYFTYYGNAVHSFTQKSAGNDPSKGAAYNEEAAVRSWNSLIHFLQDVTTR